MIIDYKKYRIWIGNTLKRMRTGPNTIAKFFSPLPPSFLDTNQQTYRL